MKKLIKLLLILSVATFIANAKTGKELAQELGIDAGSKAIVQWERIFDKKRYNKIGAEKLNEEELLALKEYLIKHAADSDQPAAAGL